MSSRTRQRRGPVAVAAPLAASLSLILTVACVSQDARPDATTGDVTAPDRVARFPDALPFQVTRADPGGEPPTDAEVEAFTRRMADFFVETDYFPWLRRLSHGVAEGAFEGEPPYMCLWDAPIVVRQGDTVTFRHVTGADNMMAHMGRVIGPVFSAYATGSGNARQRIALREMVLGYIRGVSAMFDGSIWAEEDPVVPTIMARAIFHRNHAWELDGGRKAAVDYDAVRHEVFEQRHDTIHNANNPTWGDIWVRNKRSKDDFPWVYRMHVHLARLLWTDPDPEVRGAALKLHDQFQAFFQDILESGYIIRAKAQGGKVFIPYLEGTETVDDFASMVEYEWAVENAECNAKLPVELIATGEALDNDCGDGISEIYEEVSLIRYYGHTWMQWGFHVSALATAILYGADGAQALLAGLGARMDELRVRDDKTSADPRYRPDVAQLLVLDAAYGLPLTPVEARHVMDEFTAAADHYQPFDRWDLWRDGLPDGEYDLYPARESTLGDGTQRTHVWVIEMPNLFEYCASPVRATDGARFIDCDLFRELVVQAPGPVATR
jgi:hypothetical protein